MEEKIRRIEDENKGLISPSFIPLPPSNSPRGGQRSLPSNFSELLVQGEEVQNSIGNRANDPKPEVLDVSTALAEDKSKNDQRKLELQDKYSMGRQESLSISGDAAGEELLPPKLFNSISRSASSSVASAGNNPPEKEERKLATQSDTKRQVLEKKAASSPSPVTRKVPEKKEARYEQRRKEAWEERKREIGLTSEAENVSEVAGRLRSALGTGRAVCKLGFMDTSTLCITDLEAAVIEAREIQANGENAESSWWLKYLLRAAETVLNLRKMLVQFDFQGTAELLAGAVQHVIHPDAAPEVHEVAVFLESKRELYSTAEKLLEYALQGNPKGLDMWETNAVKMKLPLSGDLYLPLCLKFARRCHAQRAMLKGNLEHCVRVADHKALRGLLRQAKIIRADKSFLEEATKRLEELTTLEKCLENGTKFILEQDLKRCCSIGQKLGVGGIEKINRFVKLQSPTLLKMRLRLALQRGNLPLAADVLYDIKSLSLSSADVQENYALKNFPQLRGARNFSLRLMIEDKTLKDGMLQFQSNHIMTSLTRLEPILATVAQRLFNHNILGWGGQIVFSHPIVLAHELLQIGVDIPALRDEIYVQILKQLTKCPEGETEKRMWQLLLFCLSTFSPTSKDFENYIDTFLRTQNKIKLLKHMYLVMLRRYLNSGSASTIQVPGRIEIMTMLEESLILI